jgi:hypothetical protein
MNAGGRLLKTSDIFNIRRSLKSVTGDQANDPPSVSPQSSVDADLDESAEQQSLCPVATDHSHFAQQSTPGLRGKLKEEVVKDLSSVLDWIQNQDASTMDKNILKTMHAKVKEIVDLTD